MSCVAQLNPDDLSVRYTANGYVLYEGPSLLDGGPIVAIAVVESSNSKTGNMLQVYILRSDAYPMNASQQGLDVSTCGACKHRRVNIGSCYVNLGQGPRAVFASYTAGKYPDISDDYDAIASVGMFRTVRLGAYGDPAAIPTDILKAITSLAIGHTGYTHQWRNRKLDASLRDYCQASADTEHEYYDAIAAGWGTYRVRARGEDLLPGETECESADGIACDECLMCDGARRNRRSIEVHGATAARYEAWSNGQ